MSIGKGRHGVHRAEKATFEELFAERRKRQIILAVPLVAMFLAFAFFSDEKNQVVLPGVPVTVVAPVFLAAVAGATIFSSGTGAALRATSILARP